MSSQNTLICDRCGATSAGVGTDESPEGWDFLSYGETDTGSDICPECVQSFQDWLKNEPQTVTVHHYYVFKTSEIVDIVERELGKKLLTGIGPKGCTCPKTKVNDPNISIGIKSWKWDYHPCPLHPITVTL